MLNPFTQELLDNADQQLQEAAKDYQQLRYEECTRKAMDVVDALDTPIMGLMSRPAAAPGTQEHRAAMILAHAYNRLNTIELSKGDLLASITWAQRGIGIATWNADWVRVAQFENNLGNAYATIDEHELALDHFQRSLDLSEQHAIDRLIPGLYAALGTVLGAAGDLDAALRYALRSRELSEQQGNWQEAAGPIHNAGNVHFRMGKLDLAIEAYHEAMDLNRRSGRVNWLINNLGNLGAAYTERGEPEKGLEYLLQSLDLHQQHGIRSVTIWAQLGKLYSRESPIQDEAKAEEYLLRSIEQRRDIGDRSFEAHEELAALYERHGRFQESLALMKEARELERESVKTSLVKRAEAIKHQRELAERDRAESIARAEAAATRRLLDTVLPASISQRMITGEERVADSYDNVSVLFADLVGFTHLSKDLSAESVIVLLNHVFDRFEAIIERHGCEKVKTIGDGFMAVAGAPDAVPDHAHRLARAALEMRGDIPLSDEVRALLPPGTTLTTRIGLHCGPVVCGVVGRQRFVWDVYSDAVNTASRMESTGEPGKIQVSESFANQLQLLLAVAEREGTANSNSLQQLTERGEVSIKGKGTMTTYWLEGGG